MGSTREAQQSSLKPNVQAPVSTPQNMILNTRPGEFRIGNVPPLNTSPTGALPMFTVGGSGSDSGENLFPVTDAANPTGNTMNFPLRETGYGMDQFGRGQARGAIEQLLQRQVDSNTPTVASGHSLGATELYNSLNKMGQMDNPSIKKNFVDAPKLEWWMAPPRPLDMTFPTVQEIHNANRNGIAGNPDTVNWTSGNWMSNPAAHSPWNYPDHPGSQEKIGNLQGKIKSQVWNPMGIPGNK